jgi:transposase
VPVLPSWLTDPLWDQFAALLPERPAVDPAHPLGCHRSRISDRIVFDKLLQLLRFGCSYQAISDTTCSATTIRNRRDEWIRLGVFARLKQIALESYDRIVGLLLDQIAVDGSITKAPGGGEVAGRSPVDRGKQGLKRSGMTDGYGIPLGRVLAGANRHGSPLLAPHPGPPGRPGAAARGHHRAPGRRLRLRQDPRRTRRARLARPHRAQGREGADPASQRWHVERTHAWQNAFHRLDRCYERRTTVIHAFFDLADTTITVRSLIRQAWTTHR